MLSTRTLYAALEACGDACARACDDNDIEDAIDYADAVRAIGTVLRNRLDGNRDTHDDDREWWEMLGETPQPITATVQMPSLRIDSEGVA
jgi:hypothetical protein